jgi:pSer/pThr/pTyr-binding forkhead associated (FHA) protein
MSTTRLVLKKVPQGNEIAIVGLMSVGRSEESALRLLEGKPSRNHAVISTDSASAFVEDLGSTNGTFINDRRIDAHVKTKLNAGDRVRFDAEEFVFGDAPAAPPVDADKTQFRAPPPRKSEAEHVPAAPPPTAPPPTAPSPAARAPAAAKPDTAPKADALPGAFEDDGSHTKFVARKKTPMPTDLGSAGSAEASGGQPFLMIVSGANAGKRIELPAEAGAKRVWSIGSGADRDICLAETGVSAKHASLTHDLNRWLLVDDLSVSGTYVNDKKTLRSFLSDGDQLMFGPIECVFRIPPGETEEVAASARFKKIGVIVAVACLVTLIVIFVLKKVLM